MALFENATGGTLSTDIANSGSMKPGQGALTPIAGGFLRWNAKLPTPRNDDISKKALALTEQNMKSAFEYARKLLHANDIQEVLQIQGEFFKGQLAAAQEQMKQMGTGAVSAVKDLEQGSQQFMTPC